MKNRSLASQLIVFILSSAALIFLAASIYSYYASKEGIIRQARENAQHLTLETVYQIETILRGVEKIPLNLAATLEHVPIERQDLVGLVQTAMLHNKELFGLGIAFEPYAFNPQYYYFMPYCCREGEGLKLRWLGSDSYRYFYQDWYQIPRELARPC
ncbi:MAG: serine/threonine protein phosphatase, partial [Deltaproteobacteria bacterium]|nr:serine/threonine protein phosphatase [Deltaproteobacteria bacterium]